MGMEVKVTYNDTIGLAVDTAKRRGLKEGGAVVLAASDALAPTEPVPRHGYHMTETGFVRSELTPDGEDQVAVGYEAFWAVFQHEDLEFHHPHGGQAKFLEVGVLESSTVALETIAASIRGALGG